VDTASKEILGFTGELSLRAKFVSFLVRTEPWRSHSTNSQLVPERPHQSKELTVQENK
jgi:hypothetical protein